MAYATYGTAGATMGPLARRRRALAKPAPPIAPATPYPMTPSLPGTPMGGPALPQVPYTEATATRAFDTATQQAGQIGAEGVALGYQRTRDFDPRTALHEYARGAWDDIMTMPGGVKEQLRDEAGRAVGAGRLDTGFYDEDRGAIYNRALHGFGNALAQQSLGAASLQQRNNAALYGIGAEQQDVHMQGLASRREEMINARREREARRRARKRGIGGLLGGVVGGVGGLILGGPAGAAAGWKIGSGIGEGVAS